LDVAELLKVKVRRMQQTDEYCYKLEKQSEEQSNRIAFLEDNLRTLTDEFKTSQEQFESKSNQFAALEKLYHTLHNELSAEKAKLLEEVSYSETAFNARSQEYENLLAKFTESQDLVKLLEMSNEELRQM
jgi:capsule polysaccharide export protein KpsE/RkpR